MTDVSAFLEGMAGLFQPMPMLYMFFGMLVASIFAAIPGVGVLLFLSVMIPFAMSLTPYEAIALLLGIATVSNTANTFASVLIAVPGSSGSQATIVDGYPMAQKGEANRAFGAAFSASALGAVFGALVFMIALPVMRPLVLTIGSPELLMLIVWGMCAVALLGGNAGLKGIIAALIGLVISTIGADGRTGYERFTFETLYLFDGVSVIIIALGIFAVPELIYFAARGTTISKTGKIVEGGLSTGIRDTFKNWWLVIRCSTIGVWVGAMPGLGSSVADWFAYAHAAQSCKNNENFGKGDVRGVIAPESSNNAKEGGALIPTTLFGIPGSTTFALILFAFIAVGIQPGQQMVTNQLPYLYAMIATLVMANLMAAALALSFSRTFSKITLISPDVVFPITVALCFIGAFSVSYAFQDLLALVCLSALGLLMKRFGWPRPALLLAVVLGPQFETYLWLSTARYGFEFLARPGVIVVVLMILATIFLPALLRFYAARRLRKLNPTTPLRPRVGDNVLLSSIVVIGLVILVHTQSWPARASLSVNSIAVLAVVLALVQLGVNVLRRRRCVAGSELEGESLETRSEIRAIAWTLGFLGMTILIGMQITTFVYPVIYMLSKGRNIWKSLAAGTASVVFLFGMFEFLVRIIWPEPLLLMLLGL